MPYKSAAQRRFAHTSRGKKAFGPSTVAEFDEASRGLHLPERSAKRPSVKRKSAKKKTLSSIMRGAKKRRKGASK
jgi:hypothetical protein